MKWTYSIKGKTKAALLLAIILGITLLTNLLERKRFKELERSFSSIYEDRLMVESYIFHLYDNLKKEEDLLQVATEQGVSQDLQRQFVVYKKDRAQLVEKYLTTYLTEEETKQFDQLKKQLEQIDLLEARINKLEPLATIPSDVVRNHEDIMTQTFSTLSALSSVQTAEGEALRNKSKRIVMRSVSMSHFEMTILIIIGLIIQGLILSSKTLRPRKHQNPSLN